MVGREYVGDTLVKYRYGMNTQEKDDEIYGKGNASFAKFWEYDTRLGRRWNIDPNYSSFPSTSTYSVNFNNPNLNKDPKGDIPGLGTLIGAVGGAAIEIVSQTVANGVQNLQSGKGFFSVWGKNMDWADVGVSAAEGALAGTTLGASLFLTTTLSTGLKASVDLKDGQLQVVGGSGKYEKTWDKAGADFATEMIGAGIAKGMGFEKAFGMLFKDANRTASKFIVKAGLKVSEKIIPGIANGAYNYSIGSLIKQLQDKLTPKYKTINLQEITITAKRPESPNKKIEISPQQEKQIQGEIMKDGEGKMK